jgi:hypothetical protein
MLRRLQTLRESRIDASQCPPIRPQVKEDERGVTFQLGIDEKRVQNVNMTLKLGNYFGDQDREGR